jgi:large subunit ribosomal protein L25
MQERVQLAVTEREAGGTSVARRLRREGLIPGVLYGVGHVTSITIDPHTLRTAMSGEQGTHAVFDVVFEGKKRAHHAVIQDMQLDRVKNTVKHIDLREVRLNDPIETSVAVQLVGTAPGVKAGGLLDIVAHEVRVKGLPGDIPEHLTIVIDELELGSVARIADLVVPEGITVLEDPEEVVCSVIPPRGAEVEEEAELVEGEEGAAEPELVGKKEAEEGA